MDRGPVALGEDTGPRDCLANWKGDLAVLRVAAQEFGVKAFNAYQERFFQALEKHGTNARYIAAFRPGAGKTILAAAWAATVRGDGNYPIVFVAPFRALCRQVATVFARFKHDFGKSYCFIGDEDSSVVPQFKAALQSGKCVIVCTPELAVTGLAGHTGTVLPILDEVHLVYDPSRGWLYDLMLRKFKGKPLLAMSGTLGKKSVSVLKAYPNAKVPCVTVGGGATATMPPVKASKYKGRAPSASSVAGLLEKLVEGHGQALCFVASKAYGYSLLGEYRSRFPRRSSEFHCADLATDVREDIEYGFSSGKIQCLIHTQTLVTGVDFDVTAGVVAQVRTGMGDVPIYDVIQAASRVGRRRPGVVHLLLRGIRSPGVPAEDRGTRLWPRAHDGYGGLLDGLPVESPCGPVRRSYGTGPPPFARHREPGEREAWGSVLRGHRDGALPRYGNGDAECGLSDRVATS
jgi:hypothetical protein